MNFQVTVLKVLVSYPDGWASLADLKRDVAVLATSGREWSERTSRLAAAMPGLEIFAQDLVERLDGGWRITDAGRAAVDLLERKPSGPELPQAQIAIRLNRRRSSLLRKPSSLLDQTAAGFNDEEVTAV